MNTFYRRKHNASIFFRGDLSNMNEIASLLRQSTTGRTINNVLNRTSNRRYPLTIFKASGSLCLLIEPLSLVYEKRKITFSNSYFPNDCMRQKVPDVRNWERRRAWVYEISHKSNFESRNVTVTNHHCNSFGLRYQMIILNFTIK